MKRKHEDFHDGAKDGLTPLEPLDLNKIDDFDQLLQAMGQTAFGGRNLGEAADVMEAMLRDPDCAVIGTFSGAMSVAKMGLLICDMIDLSAPSMKILYPALPGFMTLPRIPVSSSRPTRFP